MQNTVMLAAEASPAVMVALVVAAVKPEGLVMRGVMVEAAQEVVEDLHRCQCARQYSSCGPTATHPHTSSFASKSSSTPCDERATQRFSTW